MSCIQPSTMPTAAPPTVPFTIDTVISGMLAFPDTPDLYRIHIQSENATGGPTVKYLAAPNTVRTFTGPDAQYRRYTNLAFDHVPAGDWVVGRLLAPEEGAKLELISTHGPDALLGYGLASAGPVWCGATVDETDCVDNTPVSARWTTVSNAASKELSVPRPTDLQCMDYINARVIPTPPEVSHPAGREMDRVVRVWNWYPGHWAGIENEMCAYRIIEARDPGLAPRFLAHVTENHSRVIGFLLEYIPNVREAASGDLDKCQAVLGRLHALGIKKWQLSRHSFLVRDDGSVLVRGPFTGPPGEASKEDLREEMESLERILAQSPSAFEDQAATMLRYADPQRQKLLDEFKKAHGFLVPFVFWQEERSGRITLTLEEHGILAKEYEDNGFAWTQELQAGAEELFEPPT